jgi:ABC-type uncharacterized transport system substrate-binding protein
MPVTHCGQSLTKPVVEATQGEETLSTSGLPSVRAPRASELPPSVASDSPSIDGWSDLLVLSDNCKQGVTVIVAASPYIRTVGVAYASNHSGLTALILGRLNNAPMTLHTIQVLAFRGAQVVGEANLFL